MSECQRRSSFASSRGAMRSLVSIFAFFVSLAVPDGASALTCRRIQYEACKDVGYDLTSMPNLAGIEFESEIDYSLATFEPLVKFGCSSRLQFLLCATYAPMCVPRVPTLIGPCRPLCEGVRHRCEPVLRGLGYSWPSALNCSLLHVRNEEDHMCMDGPEETAATSAPPSSATRVAVGPPPSAPPSYCSRLAQAPLYAYINASKRCVPLCGAHVVFTSSDKSIAGIFMSICAISTFAIGFFIVVSLWLDSSLYKYPDKAAAHICLCFTVVAVGYLVRLASGSHAIACKKDPDLGVYVTITEDALTTPCVIVFLFLYYFSMAAGSWWVLHCACWFLRAWKRGLPHERFSQHSSLLHALGWGIPAGQTIACLVLRKVEADELTGTCFAGGKDPISLIRWVIVPQFVFITLGSTLVILTFACFWRNKVELKQLKKPHHHIAVSAARVGVMAIFYLLPSTCVLASVLYELTHRDQWMHNIESRPRLEVFMLKITMSLAPGLLFGLFLINSKVLNSWKRFLRRNFSSKGKPTSYLREPTLMQDLKDQGPPLGVQLPPPLPPPVHPHASLVCQKCAKIDHRKLVKKKKNSKKSPETPI